MGAETMKIVPALLTKPRSGIAEELKPSKQVIPHLDPKLRAYR
jgi:hypothetical protein